MSYACAKSAWFVVCRCDRRGVVESVSSTRCCVIFWHSCTCYHALHLAYTHCVRREFQNPVYSTVCLRTLWLHTLLYSTVTRAACLQVALQRPSSPASYILSTSSSFSQLLLLLLFFFLSAAPPDLRSARFPSEIPWLHRAQRPIPGQHCHAVVLECFPCLQRVQHSVYATSQPSLPTV